MGYSRQWFAESGDLGEGKAGHEFLGWDDLSGRQPVLAPEQRCAPFFGELGASLDDGRRQPPRFLGELGASLDNVRQADRRRRRRFFAHLSPLLETARARERELDRRLARRFNVFDYLSTDEVALSRIIADLLDPGARHGQGMLFLRTLLNELPETGGRPDPDPGFVKRIQVVTERVIADGRRLDVSVEIPGPGGPYCLAIENKPYADDQHNQVRDYLRFLKRRYQDQFLLIYLSRTGQGPSSWSLPSGELTKWTGRLAVMGYWSGPEQLSRGDRYDDFRVGLSLAAWFSACRRRCEPDRLRWFISEAETFCKRRFGGHSMATDRETGTIKKFLFDHPEHLETAQSVSDSWLEVKKVLCSGFLGHLRAELARKARAEWPDIAGDLRVGSRYGGEKSYSNWLWLHRASWKSWEGRDKKAPPAEGRTAILLQSGWTTGPNNWRWGVCLPVARWNVTDTDRERHARLIDGLRSEFGIDLNMDKVGLYRRDVDDEMASWNALLPALHQEWKAGGGEVTDFYVNGMMDIAARAIPVIDEVEGTG